MEPEARRIIRDLIRGNFRLTRHAKERMSDRRVRLSDIRKCAETFSEVITQPEGKHLIVGSDTDGEALKIVAAWDGETIIITVLGD